MGEATLPKAQDRRSVGRQGLEQETTSQAMLNPMEKAQLTNDGQVTFSSDIGLQVAPLSTGPQSTDYHSQPTRTMLFPASARPSLSSSGEQTKSDYLLKAGIEELKGTMRRWM